MIWPRNGVTGIVEPDHRREFAAAETGGDHQFRGSEAFGADADGKAVRRGVDRIDGAAGQIVAAELQQRRVQRAQQMQRMRLAVDRAERRADHAVAEARHHRVDFVAVRACACRYRRSRCACDAAARHGARIPASLTGRTPARRAGAVPHRRRWRRPSRRQVPARVRRRCGSNARRRACRRPCSAPRPGRNCRARRGTRCRPGRAVRPRRPSPRHPRRSRRPPGRRR